MLEFLLSRSVMSLCAVIVLLTVAPLAVTIHQYGGNVPGNSLEELASRFEDIAILPGEARIRIEVRDYLGSESNHFVLYQRSIWLVGPQGRFAHSIPFDCRLFLTSLLYQKEVTEADLDWNSVMTLNKWSDRNGTRIEAHIENFEATSLTFMANLSTSSKVL